MSKINNKTITIIKNVALYFFVICFSLSNISLFNMVLSYAGYQGDVTLISSIIYAFLNLFILVFFIYYVLSHKQYKIFLIILLINLIYIFPHLLNFTIRDIALYLMFPLPFSLFAGIIAVDQNIRKRFIDAFYKLRYVYSILGIAYISFLVFSTKENLGALIDFTYGNVAWVFLPPIFIYIGLLIQKNFFRKSEHSVYKKYDLIGILLLLKTVVFYTGLRSGIISLLFALFLFLIIFLIVDFEHKQNYMLNALIIVFLFVLAFVISMIFKLDTSRLSMISSNFIFEKRTHNFDELLEKNNSSTATIVEIEDEEYKKAEEQKEPNTNNNANNEGDQVESITEDIVYLTTSLPIRPSKGSTESLGSLPKGTKVQGVKEGVWFRFEYEDQEAYIASKYTSTEILAKEIVYTTRYLPIRPQKNSSESLGSLKIWTKIEGYREGAWFRFVYKDQECFIASEFTTTKAPSEEELINAEKEKRIIENSSKSNIIDEVRIIDLEDNQVISLHAVFIKHIVRNDLTKSTTEELLQKDVVKDTQEYIFAREKDRERISNYTITKDRYNLWTMAFGEFKKSPLIGQGALFYQTKYDEFFPHNIILEILTDFGIIGLIITMSIAILLIYKSINYIRQKKDKSMLLILTFGLSYIPAYLLYNSLYSDNSLAFLITLLTTYVIFNKEKTEKIEKKLSKKL